MGVIQELINENTLTCDQIRDALAEDFHMDIVDLDDVEIYPELLDALRHQDENTGQTLAERYHAFPVYMEDGTLYIALTDPTNIDATDDIAQYLNLEIITYLASATNSRTSSTAPMPPSAAKVATPRILSKPPTNWTTLM